MSDSGMTVTPTDRKICDLDSAWKFITKDAQCNVFYKWVKTEVDDTDPSTTITTIGTFVIMEEFPIRQVYSLGYGENKSKSKASALVKRKTLDFAQLLIGTTVTTTALKQ